MRKFNTDLCVYIALIIAVASFGTQCQKCRAERDELRQQIKVLLEQK